MSAPADEHVDWDLARRIAVKVAGTEPLYRSYLAEPLRADFARFVPVAAELVAIETGLETPGEAHAEVIDRAGWIDANIAAFRRLLQPLLGDGGLAAVFASEQQRDLIAQVGGMMSLVEGHGDVTMARAARGHIPDAERFALVMSHRRRNARGMNRLLQRLLGIEAKLAQYQAGEEFIAEIEAERGPRAVDRIWERAEHLPSMTEIRNPTAWLERVPAA